MECIKQGSVITWLIFRDTHEEKGDLARLPAHVARWAIGDKRIEIGYGEGKNCTGLNRAAKSVQKTLVQA